MDDYDEEAAAVIRDAERYRWLKKDHAMLWTKELDGSIKWVRYIKMDEPDLREGFLTETSVMDALDCAIDAAIVSERNPVGTD